MRKVNIEELLDNMTLEEKIGQLMLLTPDFFDPMKTGMITGPLGELNMEEEVIWRSGSVIGVTDAKDMMDIQRSYLEKSRLKIPLLFMLDINHGYRTIFPIPLAVACTWDPGAAERAARITAIEASLSGVHVNFAPMTDLIRDPRWGRVMETTGEDPYLNGLFAAASVRGYQGDGRDPHNIISCVKHFAGYGAVESGREYNTVDMSDRTLREFYLPSYQAAIDAGCKMVMAAFNPIHGIPATGNRYLMRDILRNQFGFDGVVISDWASIEELKVHGVAADGAEAARLAIEAGVDIELMTSNYVNHLKQLIEKGEISPFLLDEAVLRILRLKESFGLFHNPFKSADPKRAKTVSLCGEFRQNARDIAANSMVLLKNENILPFRKDQKIAVIGPFADHPEILGAWHALGQSEEAISVYQGICNKIGRDMVVCAKGCDIFETEECEFTEAIQAAAEAEVILLALGEDQDMSGEAASRAFLALPGDQEKLAQKVLQLNKPTAVLLFGGRPLEIRELAQSAPALIEAWFPGTEGGNAAADILYGDVNPSGRLTMSFPYTVGQIPVYYNEYSTGRPYKKERKDTSKYIDIPNEPLYPFGYGLSYSTFEYRGIFVSKTQMDRESAITAFVTIKNTGDRTGTETVQLYIRDMVASVVRPKKELKGFQRITLEPGEEKRAAFQITAEMLGFHDFYGNYTVEPGEFEVMIGCNSEQTDRAVFRLL